MFHGFYEGHLPFALTNAQKRVLKEIRADVKSGRQMNRLLQGDVGSGKTVVAVLTALMAMDNGFQTALLAPTEILAQQHFLGISELLSPLGIQVGILTGSSKKAERIKLHAALQNGEIALLVGTHALLEEAVQFQNLGMAIIDEQHRFGVAQRARLWEKARSLPPHVLVMTATPIPRTLAMTLYGDLDVSVIDELPPGRKNVITIHKGEEVRNEVYRFIRQQVEAGRQIYLVYPLIDESKKLDYKNMLEGFEVFKQHLPDIPADVLHGQMKPADKESVMARFVKGHVKVLVSTTVIEVGVNVPNASVMVIESAERFGLSQLHQLRGRVGRGAEQSYCILLTGRNLSKEAKERMAVMVATNDGFKIAEKDLELRGPGDIEGTRQSGEMQFKLASLVEDAPVLEQVRSAVWHIIERDPELQAPEHAALLRYLQARERSQGPWAMIS
jgi:ATP-dependent DNA helicase RecG